MTLGSLLEALKDNAGMKLSVFDGTEAVITFFAAGYQALSDELMARTVDRIIFDEELFFAGIYLEAVQEVPTDDNNP